MHAQGLVRILHKIIRDGRSTIYKERGSPKGKTRRSRPLSPGSAPPTAPVLVVSSISVVGGSSGGGALRKPSLCKLNAKMTFL